MNVRNLAVWGLIAALLIGTMMAMQSNGATAGADEINISEVRSMAEAGQIEELTITSSRIDGERKDGTLFWAEKLPSNIDFSNDMQRAGVNVIEDADTGVSLGSILFNVFPLLLFLFFGLYLMRSMQSGGGRGAMSFGKSEGRASGSRRLSKRPCKIPASRRQDSQRRSARWPARNR